MAKIQSRKITLGWCKVPCRTLYKACFLSWHLKCLQQILWIGYYVLDRYTQTKLIFHGKRAWKATSLGDKLSKVGCQGRQGVSIYHSKDCSRNGGCVRLENKSSLSSSAKYLLAPRYPSQTFTVVKNRKNTWQNCMLLWTVLWALSSKQHWRCFRGW